MDSLFQAQAPLRRNKNDMQCKTEKSDRIRGFAEIVSSDEMLPDALNWLLPSVVGLFFPPLTGGENIWKEKYSHKPRISLDSITVVAIILKEPNDFQ